MAHSFLKDYNDPVVQNCTTYIDVIKNRTIEKPNHIVFRFLSDGVNENESYTYYQLEKRSKALGAIMQKNGRKGDRVLILFQPSLSYTSSLYACFYSGFVAVPAYPPRRNRGIDRIRTIIKDSGAKQCLISRQVYDDVQQNFKDDDLFSKLQWIVYEDIPDSMSEGFDETEIHPEDIALLQYTSGSTGNPKGVMITQLNLLYNSEYIRQTFGLSDKTIGVNWLPVFHDMGLIGGIMQVAYTGGVNIGLPPVEFLKKPLNWLKAIDKYRGTTAGGPNFSYDYCIQKTTEDDRKNLDLSSMTVFFCGAEPIRKSTYKEFTEKFAVSNSREEQFYSCYGLAEATLIVTGGYRSDKPKYIEVDADSLSNNKVKIVDDNSGGISLVGCGYLWMDTVVEIVNPFTLTKLQFHEIGEVWIKGPTVAKGYWNKPEETKRTFGALISDTNEDPYIRTGDLGFFYENELFITGRLKDLIIIRGVNYYPSDIEYSIQNAIPELRKNGGAAFPVTVSEVENLVIVQELERTAMRNTDHDIIINHIRKVIAEEHELEATSIVLIRTGSIPITSSGKIQHRQTKFEFLNGELNIVAHWDRLETKDGQSESLTDIVPTEESIKEWVINWIIRNQQFRREEIDLDKNIMSYGIDSLAAVTLETEISKQFGFHWHVSSFILNPTINKLAEEGMEIYRMSNDEF